MTTRRDRPASDADDDRADTADQHIGDDPMHPHPQDRSAADAADPPDRDAPDAAGRDDDETPVDRYGGSPGIGATRPMDEAGDVAEPNEPA